jgi:hypothetical protein
MGRIQSFIGCLEYRIDLMSRRLGNTKVLGTCGEAMVVIVLRKGGDIERAGRMSGEGGAII